MVIRHDPLSWWTPKCSPKDVVVAIVQKSLIIWYGAYSAVERVAVAQRCLQCNDFGVGEMFWLECVRVSTHTERMGRCNDITTRRFIIALE